MFKEPSQLTINITSKRFIYFEVVGANVNELPPRQRIYLQNHCQGREVEITLLKKYESIHK